MSASIPAVQAVLEAALPMIKLLLQRETDEKVFDSPDRKAALDKSLHEKIKLTRDPVTLRARNQKPALATVSPEATFSRPDLAATWDMASPT